MEMKTKKLGNKPKETRFRKNTGRFE